MAVNRKPKETSATEKKPKQSKKTLTVKKSNEISEIYFKTVFENASVSVILLDLKEIFSTLILHFKDC